MAAYVPTPRDLSKVKSKILFNLTKRQLLCFGAAARWVTCIFRIKGNRKYQLGSSWHDVCHAAIILSCYVRKRWSAVGGYCETVL